MQNMLHQPALLRPKSRQTEVGREPRPAAGLPAGWTRWKAGPQAVKACPTAHSACRITLVARRSECVSTAQPLPLVTAQFRPRFAEPRPEGAVL